MKSVHVGCKPTLNFFPSVFRALKKEELCILEVFESNEQSEYSLIVLGDFFAIFFRKVLKICSRSVLIFGGLSFNFF